MADLAVRASELVKWFGEGETRTIAVRGVSLDVYFGEMLYIEGPSGSGKTTLLSMISGILRPNSGTVIVKDKELWSLSSDKIADFRLSTHSSHSVTGNVLFRIFSCDLFFIRKFRFFSHM